MSTRLDILMDENFDLLEDPVTFDFIEGESTRQHQDLIIIAEKGSFKESPISTVGAFFYLESESTGANDMMNEIKKQFIADGMQINAITTVTGNQQIDATYK